METIINAIQNADKVVAAVYALAGTIAAAIIGIIVYYKQVRAALEKAQAKEEFNAIAAPISAIAETRPLEVLNGLATKIVDPLPSIANMNDSKALIVAQAAIETAKKDKPSILKTLGINSATDAVPLISGLYSIIKPLVKKK